MRRDCTFASVGDGWRLADEVLAADAIVVASPLYNFGVPQHLKTWIDLLITDPRLGPGTAPLTGRPLALVIARGGGYGPGTPRAGWDHATPYLQQIFGAVLGAEVHIGNFVEVKNSTLANGAKANHLAYLGDSTVGERVNFGAGSITANYDGVNKHRTVIGNDVHVGSNCVLVAPVTLGAGATVGGGSTIAKDAPPGQLSVARAKKVSRAGWKRPAKKPAA